ncbi:prefoldin subunit alpha [Candidatus Woesearchaeota archaeon]|jgi:prefoldin alpha subunit|nr:prefoldin subunit alpha [Candidatus Woesearchaeota archaeon]
MIKEKATQGYMQLQIIVNQLNQLQEQFRMVDNQLAELEIIKNSIDELKDIKKGSEILSPISNGIFVKSALKDNKNFIVNIGGGVTVTKNQEQLREFLNKQTNEIKKIQTDLFTQIQSLNLQADYLKKEISKSVM